MKKHLLATALLCASAFSTVQAADYVIDTKGAHASINFKVKHLNYSWLTGRFDKFSGEFSYDENDISNAKISLEIDATSVNTNHARRDKHIRTKDYLDSSKFSTAKFVSTKVIDLGNNKLTVIGDLTLHGVTKSITIDAEKIGEGKDPWGGYRAGFSGKTKILMPEFGIDNNYGAVEFDLHIEGKRK